MTVQQAINRLIKWGEAQVGYKAKAGKVNKYAEWIDQYPDFYNFRKQGVDWCDIWYDVGICQCFTVGIGRQMLYQPKKSTGAGCGFSAGFYRKNNAWSKVPQLGAQIFYGPSGNESHTGMVVAIEGAYIWTIEGNTGGGNGEVQKKKVAINNRNISGYGIPNWKLVSSAPKFQPQWGIDISVWQGDYNLAQAKKEGVKFVILRGGGGDDGIYKDSRFEQNYQKAKSLGLPVGVYWFAGQSNNTRMLSEAEFFVKKVLAGKQFEMPIYIDCEQGFLKNSKRAITDATLTWLKYVRNAGYWVGIYSSTSAFASCMYDSELKSYAHWVADWRGKCYYPNYYGMWQFGGDTNPIRSKYVAGKKTDQNYVYEDYETEIKAKGLNGWGKQPKPKFKLDVDGIGGYNTVYSLQTWRGTYPDGVISGQLKNQAPNYPAIINVEFGKGGSPCIESIQKWLVAEGFKVGSYGADGVLGKDTGKAWQDCMIKKKYLTENNRKKDGVGIIGTETVKAIQRMMNDVLYK